MAEECELFDGIWSHPELKELKSDKFIKFANLVSAIEREACAKVAESYEPECDTCPSGVSNAIRARGHE